MYVGNTDIIWSEIVQNRVCFDACIGTVAPSFTSNEAKKVALVSIENTEAEIIWLYAAYNR